MWAAHKHSRRSAFTLIELLVVISVIALLMGILMPALRAAKKQAQGIICQAHLKQWGLCYHLYTDDNDGLYPSFFAGTVQTTFMESLRSYYNNINKIRTCPAASQVSTEVPTGLQPESYFGKTFSAWQIDPSAEWLDDKDWGIGSYGENSWIRGPAQSSNLQNWVSSHKIKHLNDVPLLGDARWNNAWPDSGKYLQYPGMKPWPIASAIGRPCPAMPCDDTKTGSIWSWPTAP